MTVKTSLDLLQIYCTILQQMQQKLRWQTLTQLSIYNIQNIWKMFTKCFYLVEILCGIFAHMCTSVCV